jgi:hypothetical protein
VAHQSTPPKHGQIKDQNFSITVEHLATARAVSFDGWVTGFSDSFVSSWKGTPVYGRMDNLHTFQRTGRKISIAFDVLASDGDEAHTNQGKLNALTQFLYPVYSDEGTGENSLKKNQRVLVAPPLLRMKWVNLMESSVGSKGLVGFLNGFSYSPVIISGQFFPPGRVGQEAEDPASRTATAINYQQFNVQVEYTVLHTHLTGFSRDSNGEYIFGGSEDLGDLTDFPHRPGEGSTDSSRTTLETAADKRHKALKERVESAEYSEVIRRTLVAERRKEKLLQEQHEARMAEILAAPAGIGEK